MKVFDFSKNKYGIEFLMDLGDNNDIPNYFFSEELHCTSFFEIIFFSKGNGFLELDDRCINLEQNTVIFITPFQKRKWYVKTSEINCYFLLFHENFLSNFFSDKFFIFRLQYFYNKTYPLAIQIDNELHFQMHAIFKELKKELDEIKSDSTHLVRSLLYYILIKLNRIYSACFNISEETEANHLVFLFKQLLVTNIKEQRSIDFYTKKLRISRVTLNKHIKSQFGINVSQMIDLFLISEIKCALIYSDLSIKEIASKFSFSEPNHLARFFKKHSQMTPVEYRVSYQKGT